MKNTSRRVLSAFLAFVMVFLMIPVSVFTASAETPDYSVPTTGHKLLSSYNVLSGTDISTTGSASALDIFNRSKLDELIKNYASYDDRHAQFGEERKGSTMTSFTNNAGFSISRSVGVNVGIDKLFKISADKKFKLSGDISYSEALETYFYEYAITVQKGYYNFNQAHLEEVRDFSNGYLSETFINALTGEDGSSAEEFFNTYGTHIITSYTAGGTAGVYSSTVKTSTSSAVSLEAMYSSNIGASGTIEGIQLGGNDALDFQATVKGKSDESNCITNSDTYAHGGDSSICFKDGTFEYTNWVNSIDSENAIILIDEHLKMVPIWNLMPVTGHEDRILELTTYFMDMIEQQDSDFYTHFAIDETLFDYSRDWLNFENCKIITNEEELNDIRNDLNGVYVLANNIILSDYADWTPIGTKDDPFRGRLYGNYNTISGLNISQNASKDSSGPTLIGLFGCNDGLITDLKISGNIVISEMNTTNVYIGAIAAYNEGIINNCFDDVLYDIENSSIDYFNFSIESEFVEANKSYYVRDGLGIHLIGQADSTYSNVNIVVEESKNVGPVYIVLEDVNLVGSSSNGTIYNPTSRPIYLISLGTSNTIKGATSATGINTPNSNLHIFGTSELSVYGGKGGNGGNGGEGARGGDGGIGGNGIVANKVFATIHKFNVTGGNGGNGGNGGGNVYGHGGHGGHGGHAGNAIVCNQIAVTCENSLITGGVGGSGGAGGNDSGINAKDGNGGNGGNGGFAISPNINIEIFCKKVMLVGGKGGSGGSGQDNGSWGGSGTNASPKAEIYIENKRYTLYDTTKTWTNAKSSAESNGAYLATITSESEQSIINELMSYGNLNDYYIGAYRAENDANVWAWVTGEEFSFAIWKSGEPNNGSGSEDYVGIYKDKLAWNDYPDVAHGYIEEYDLNFDDGSIKDCFTGIIVGNNSEKGKIRNYNASVWQDNLLQINSVSKTDYFSGDKFNVSTVGIYMYGKPVSDYGMSFDSSCKGTALSKMGEVKITKDGYVRNIPVHVTKTIPQYIEIATLGKTEFAVGEDFDISGLSINVIYNNGSQQSLAEKDILYTTPKIEYANQIEEVVITYQESGLNFSTSYQITTVTDTVDSIFIQTPATTTYYKQGEELDITGLEIYGVYKSGAIKPINNNYLKFDVSPSLCNVGTSVVTIKYEGKTVTYMITVEENKNFDHAWDDGIVTVDPTHTTTGVMTYHCTVENCDVTKTETIPTLEGHTYGDWYTLNDMQHQRMCECGDTIVLDHVWDSGITTTPATHLTVGESLHTCDVCDAIETRTIEKTATHAFDKWIKYDDIQHSHSCECGEVEYGDHDWDGGTVTIEPTYTTTGLMTYTCVDCGATATEEISVLEIPENAPYIVVDNKNAVIGKTVTVKISLKNNTGITSMRINVAYDNATLKLTNVKYNALMGGQTVLPENIDALNGTVVLYWANGFANYSQDDVFATLTFDVADTASADTVTTISVTYDAEDIYDVDETNVNFFCDDGIITLIDYIPGDINGDGVVNPKDTTRLMRYLAKWDVEVNEAALDVNGDGVVNTKDTTRLMRYLAGWDVEIF